MGWRDSLYAFLLRRVLGPYLSTESLKQLHNSIDVSLEEGRFCLNNIELNATYLSSKLRNVHVRNIRVRKLQILLTLREQTEDASSSSNSSSTTSVTWRAMNLGRQGMGGVALLAHLEIDGLEVNLAPGSSVDDESMMNPSVVEPASTEESASNMISAYIDAALASLRLSIDLKNIKIRTDASDKWIELGLTYAKYHDRSSQHVATINKAIDFSGISITTGNVDRCDLIAKLDGGGQLSLQAKAMGREKMIQQDISVNFYQRINFSVSEQSLTVILAVAEGFSTSDSPAPHPMASLASSEYFELPPEAIGNDEQDVETMKGILEQYAEARHSAERNEIRGGILVQDDDSTSFDAFFDANELSFSKYRSTLEESILTPTDDNTTIANDDDFVHTQLAIHIGQCRIKVSFPKQNDDFPADYLLLTFSDMNSSLEISKTSVNATLSLAQAEAESSQLSKDGIVEIETLIRFELEDDLSNVVSSVPSIDVHFFSQSGSKRNVEVRLHTLELFCNNRTLENCMALSRSISAIRNTAGSQSGSAKLPQYDTEYSLLCSSLTILLPVNGMEDKGYHNLFERCGYPIVQDVPLQSACIGVSLDDISVSSVTRAGDTLSVQKVSALRTLLFVVAPERGESYRIDVLTLAGQVPLVASRTVSSRSGNTNVGRDVFPMVSSISSFKARQEDDDDDIDQSNTRSEVLDSLRSPDPQPSMLKEAAACTEAISIVVPDVTIDIAQNELDFWLLAKEALSTSKAKGDGSEEVSRGPVAKQIALSLVIEQSTFCVHSKVNTSVKLIGKGWKFFTVTNGSKVKCARVMAHVFDFYTAQKLVYRERNKEPREASSIREHCDWVRQRTVRREATKAVPVLYRSHLFPSLSADSPSALVDMINGSDEQFSEWTIHFTIYNITHRFDIGSLWLSHLSAFLPEKKADVSPDLESRNEEPKEGGDAGSSLTKLFVTFADCNIDYSSADEFETASRTIMRVSDLRLSSNVIRPAQPVQAFRLSIGDISILIGNRRHPYNSENVCLPRSRTILATSELSVNGKSSSPDLQAMNMVTLLTLDSVVIAMSVASGSKQAYMRLHGVNDPNIAAQVSVGTICLFGCKDSFECFVDSIGDVATKLTSLSQDQVEALRLKNISIDEGENDLADSDSSGDQFYDSSPGLAVSDLPILESSNAEEVKARPLGNPSVSRQNHVHESFELDGYDWTTIDHEWSKEELPSGEEQTARWYGEGSAKSSQDSPEKNGWSAFGPQAKPTKHLHLISHYIQLKPSPDPLAEGDMDAARHAGTANPPPVSARISILELKVKCRFFDGYDWPQDVKPKAEARRKYAFIIDHTLDRKEDDELANTKNTEPIAENSSRKNQLMGALLDGAPATDQSSRAFHKVPLPEERAAMIKKRADQRKLARRMNRFLQVSFSGLKLRMDTFEESLRHRLASCLDVRVEDLFIAETISSSQPSKLIGEWLNDVEHPRDTKHGLVMLKMVTWKPKIRVNDNNEVMSDESQAVLQLLPLRCHIDQRALRFARAFFTSAEAKAEKTWAAELTEVPPPIFQLFRIKPCKLKVNYNPEKVDVDALRDGSVVELVNISPLNDMVITLQATELTDKVGFGEVFGEMARSWIRDIVSRQLHKFVTNSSPFQPFTSISTGAVDMVVLPWDAVKNGESISRALQSGAKSFAGTIVYETLNVTAKLTSFAATQVSSLVSSPQQRLSNASLPSRPASLPRTLGDTADHALESIARGLETANYKIIIIPYREYQRNGATGAVRSVIRGIPVAILAPLGAASEALSYTLLGARNQVRPDIRKEEEASQKGLSYDL